LIWMGVKKRAGLTRANRFDVFTPTTTIGTIRNARELLLAMPTSGAHVRDIGQGAGIWVIFLGVHGTNCGLSVTIEHLYVALDLLLRVTNHGCAALVSLRQTSRQKLNSEDQSGFHERSP
jgi:hypothetical protein